ncbi:hypothetical protein BC826DRAFT_1113983 [Russula brevipes]|nr:hypothetical protein BC826DRAFT_1113983 [Russula brevipes]
MRYRRALRELKAAEQQFGANMALEHARQATLARQRAAAEVARRKCVTALQAKIPRIQRNEHAHPDADAEGVPVPQCHFIETTPTRSRPTPPPARRDEEVLTVGELLGLGLGLPTPSEVQHSAEPQSKPQSHNGAEVALKEFLELFNDIASQPRAAGGYQPIYQRDVIPSNEKPKGKSEAESLPQPTLLLALLSERIKGALEMRDVEQAIKLSTQGRGAVDEKKAALPRWSAPVLTKIKASSSLVRAGSTRSPMSTSIPTRAPEPVSPLTLTTPTLQSPRIMHHYAPTKIRYAQREAAREVEKALEDVERKVKERAPQCTATEVTKEEVKGHDVESEEPDAAAGTQDILLAAHYEGC